MSWWNKKNFFKFKAVTPNLESYIGKLVRIPGEPDPILIADIRGNIGLSIGREKPRPTFYEINGKYLINMLRFHAQMTGDKSITEQQFLDFENMEFESEKMPETNLLLDKRKDAPKYEPQ